jgi:hypothetical protein
MLPPGSKNWQLISPHWDIFKWIFLEVFLGQWDLSEDHMVWLDGARLPHVSFIGPAFA